MRRRWKILFGISLFLNAILIGYVAGGLSRPVDTLRMAARFSEHYPPEIRRTMRRTLLAERNTLMADIRSLVAAREVLMKAYAAPTPDPAEISRLQENVRALTTRLQKRFQDRTTGAVLSQPAEVRARISTPRSPAGIGLPDPD